MQVSAVVDGKVDKVVGFVVAMGLFLKASKKGAVVAVALGGPVAVVYILPEFSSGLGCCCGCCCFGRF